MEKLTCARCGGEYFLPGGCACDPVRLGPHTCPECGGILRRTAPSYVFSNTGDEE